MTQATPTTTDWGAVEADVMAALTAGLGTEARAVRSAISEKRADEAPKGLNSVFTVSRGTTATLDGGGNGEIRSTEDWTLDVLIYGASGLTQDQDRRAIQTLAARVKYLLNGYSPDGQVDNNGFLVLERDAPVQDYASTASAGLKIRQTYTLSTVLISQVTGAAAA